jgi:hypothetical protein
MASKTPSVVGYEITTLLKRFEERKPKEASLNFTNEKPSPIPFDYDQDNPRFYRISFDVPVDIPPEDNETCTNEAVEEAVVMVCDRIISTMNLNRKIWVYQLSFETTLFSRFNCEQRLEKSFTFWVGPYHQPGKYLDNP